MKILLQELVNNYDTGKLIKFFEEKSALFTMSNEQLNDTKDNLITFTKKVGEIKFQAWEKLVVIESFVNKNLDEKSSKKDQYEFAKSILKKYDYSSGIFVFIDKNKNFRFSLVYSEAISTRRDWSNFHRYTYFIENGEPARTFIDQIADSSFDSMLTIIDAFSVDKITTQFFSLFRFQFEELKKHFISQNKLVYSQLKDIEDEEYANETINKFCFVTLGRIFFIYFLQKKGWLNGDRHFIANRIKDGKYSNLLYSLFGVLFFDVFAKKKDDRKQGLAGEFKEMPYLNGGLFEKTDFEKKFDYIKIEDSYFKNLILDFMEHYNFTIEEDTPFDKEVSIDPEMLGKVFENLLAEEERNAKGTFYTPREIVHYMTCESIAQLLRNETEIDEKIITELVYKNKTDKLFVDHKRIIDSKLKNIKILDPAVGSGAFPVGMIHELIRIRKALNVSVGENYNEALLKKEIIRNNIYGVDIDPGAIEIAKLRVWLSLVVDYNLDDLEPLPNLDFQFRVGNSLEEKVAGFTIVEHQSHSQDRKAEQVSFLPSNKPSQITIDYGYDSASKYILEMKNIIDEYFKEEDEERRNNLKKQFDHIEELIFQSRINDLTKQAKEQSKNIRQSEKIHKAFEKTIEDISILEKMVKHNIHKMFIPRLHFAEVFEEKNGFDVVIGNPPYGVKVDDRIKNWHELGSKDSYGIFISTAIRRFLKDGGTLSYIVSDTWLTIKTHQELRKQVLDKRLHKIVRVNQDCFDATVNACVMSLTNKTDNNGKLITADLTNISTRKEVEELREKLYDLAKFVGKSTPKFAVYEYNQDLIKTNSNMPVFAGSPKLFALMNDMTCQNEKREIADKRIKVRQIKLNDKIIELARFGDIAEIRQGLATGDNHSYLFQNPLSRGSYKSIFDYKKYLLNEKDLEKIANDNNLRLNVIENGFYKSIEDRNFDENLWFEGRYIVPYDKGGESDTETGWLPNYYVPTNYFIDWSRNAVNRMKTLTIGERDGTDRKQKCAVIRSPLTYFLTGITFSSRGVYAPTFRIHESFPYDKESSCAFSSLETSELLGKLTCKITSYIFRNFVQHTISADVDALKEMIFVAKENLEISKLVKRIIEKQKQNLRYDYLSNEQKEIDKMAYEMYGLNDDDIREVETWYARRYPKLARFCDLPSEETEIIEDSTK